MYCNTIERYGTFNTKHRVGTNKRMKIHEKCIIEAFVTKEM